MPNVDGIALKVWVEGNSSDAIVIRRALGRSGEVAADLGESDAVIIFGHDQLDELAITKKPILVLLPGDDRDASARQAKDGRRNVAFRSAIQYGQLTALRETIREVTEQSLKEMADAAANLRGA